MEAFGPELEPVEFFTTEPDWLLEILTSTSKKSGEKPVRLIYQLANQFIEKSLLLKFHEDIQDETHIIRRVSNTSNFYFSLSRAIYANTKNEGKTLSKLSIQ